MSVASLGAYDFPSRDALANYKGKQLVYVNWEEHRMFSRPFVVTFDPKAAFAELLATIKESYEYHPDFEHIEWDRVIWQNSETVFTPDPAKSLAENGIGHKDLIRFTTPGLHGLNGSGY